MFKKIPVSEPYLTSLESEYVNSALKEGAISGFFGDYINRFEKEFADFCDVPYAVSCSNGTTALHLAAVALDIQRDDEVLVSTLTNMATFFAILYQGAKPIPIDIDPTTLNLDPALLEKKITPKTKAILVVHLFGHTVDMDPVMAVARKHGLKVIEDCAEAHGALYKGRKVGSIGDIGCFSFYANKIITTGEGGMLTFKDKALAEKSKSLKSLAFGDEMKFMHKYVGYNYRMTNIQAAIGCAQMPRIDEIIDRKRKTAARYTEQLKSVACLQLPVEQPYAKNVYWMYHMVLKGRAGQNRAAIMKRLAERGVETREGFVPYNMQKVFIDQGLTRFDECPLANAVALTGFYLPSSPLLTLEQQDYVVHHVKEILAEY